MATRIVLATTLAALLSGPALAQVETARPAAPAPVDAHDHGFNWGLLGLLGLGGLAGLTRRGESKDYRPERPLTGSRA
jgi:hypothetical protein